MTTLHDAISLSKSAGILAGNNSETNTMEVADLYEASYVKFAMVADDPNADKTETLIQWGIALTNHYKYVLREERKTSLYKQMLIPVIRLKGLKGEEAEKIFETAQQKYETALLTGKDATHLILSNWGNLLLEKVFIFFSILSFRQFLHVHFLIFLHISPISPISFFTILLFWLFLFSFPFAIIFSQPIIPYINATGEKIKGRKQRFGTGKSSTRITEIFGII
jgi:hypothetical protein